MVLITEEIVQQFEILMEKVDEPLKKTFQNMDYGHEREALVRFLNAREGNISNAHKMLMECLSWRIQNNIDDILAKPINPIEFYRGIRDSQLTGMCGYSKEGHPVIAVGVGRSTYDKASMHYYIQSHIQMNEYRDRVILPSATKKFGHYIGTCFKILDMTGLKFSAMNQLKECNEEILPSMASEFIHNHTKSFMGSGLHLLTIRAHHPVFVIDLLSNTCLLSAISTIDDLNYPEKTETYYIVNAPYIFSACWKVVKPLLRERTRKKVQVLSGCGRDELLKIMDYESLPQFCRKEGSGSSRGDKKVSDCFSLDHPFHQQLHNYVKEQAARVGLTAPVRHGSFHVDCPEPDPADVKIAETIECEFQRLGNKNGLSHSSSCELKVNGD